MTPEAAGEVAFEQGVGIDDGRRRADSEVEGRSDAYGVQGGACGGFGERGNRVCDLASCESGRHEDG